MTTVELPRPAPGAAPTGPVLLACEGLDVAYGPVQVLFGVDLRVHEGEIVGLLGTNGAGKSTLLRAVTGLSPPRAGTVHLDGEDITGADPALVAARGVSFMPGGRAIFPGLTVAENLELAGWLDRGDRARRDAAAERVLELFPALRSRAGDRAALLSGGQQQMLALAQALLTNPRLLLIDELSLGLAPVVVSELIDVVRRLRSDSGVTVVLVEQSVNVALELADRAVFMEKGEVRFSGPAADLAGRTDLLRSVFIGADASEPSPGRARRAPDAETGPPLLSATSLGVRFGGITAVDDVSLDVAAGEIVGIIGANGAGKTTLLDLLTGFVRPTSGRASFDSEDVTDWSPERRAWVGMARSFQDARLFPGLTVAENLAVALERFTPNRDPVAAAMRLPAALLSELLVARQVDELIVLLGLDAFRDKYVSQLSTGSRRIVELGSLVAQRARLILLDEPSAGIAQKESEALGPLLVRVRDATGAALVIIEHDVPLLMATCDRLVAMELGAVIAAGPPEEIVNDPRVIASYLGTDVAAIGRSGVVAAQSRPGRQLRARDSRRSRGEKPG